MLPSPRLPPGTRLPSGFPYHFEGLLTSSWASVGVLLAPEIASAIHLLEGFCEYRALWMLLPQAPPTPARAICALSAPPGGDFKFWEHLLKARKAVMATSGATRSLLVGDANIHLPYVVSHCVGCKSLHCKPHANYKRVAQLLLEHGLHCSSPINVPTHDSGTTSTYLSRSAKPHHWTFKLCRQAQWRARTTPQFLLRLSFQLNACIAQGSAGCAGPRASSGPRRYVPSIKPWANWQPLPTCWHHRHG